MEPHGGEQEATISQGDLAALGGYLGLALATLVLAEGLRRRGMPHALTRKLVHGVAGISPLYVTAVATHRWAGLLPYTLTLFLNAAIWRRGWLRSITSAQDTPGIVYFPLIQLALLAWLWQPNQHDDHPSVAHAALLTLALGDAAAALIGQRYGKHPYTVLGSQRSLEGSAAMLGVSWLTIALTLRAHGTPACESGTAGFGAALVATLTEAGSPKGLDNLTVPLAVALLLRFGMPIALRPNGNGPK